MGRKPKVSQKEVIELIEKHIHRLATNDFPPYGDTLWKTMSQDLDGRWLPRSVYTHVRYDKRGDLAQARRNQGICTSPETKPYLIEDEIDEIESDHEELCTSEPDDDYVPEDIRNENLQECDSFDLLLTSEEWSLIKPDESKSKNRLKTETWASVITRAFWKRYNFSCAFCAKWSYVRSFFNPQDDEYYLKFFAYCKDRIKCKNIMIGTANSEPTSNGLRLTIKTRDTRGDYHVDVKRPLRGAERKQVGEKLQKQSAANYQNELLRDNMQFGDDVPHFVQENYIYRQARMEKHKENAGMKPNEKNDVIKSLQKMSTDPRYINTIHEIGCMKFHVLYCTQEQLHVFNEYCRVLGTSSAISIDASGRFAQAFEICPGRMTGHIFLYTVTIRFEGKTICVHQMLTEIHTQEFIELWLKYWVRLGAKTPGESWSDYERGIPMSSCLTFNGKSLKDYIDDVFEWARTTDKKKSRPDNTLIRIDVAHLMALVARWKCLKHKDHPYIKNFFVRCVALMVDTQSIEEFQQIFLLTCIVALQPYEDNFVSTSTINMTVSDARKELEGHMSVRKSVICDIEASMTSYLEEKGNTSKPFEESENGTRTHQWIKKLIASVTPSDMSGNSVNAFYLPDFVKELTRIAKEFPLWTAAAIPVAGKHASTAHQEGYFAILRERVFEHIRLPCPGNRFVLEHLHSLKSGSNLLAAKLKHFNHQREVLSTPTLKDETVEENENSHPKSPPKRNHLIDDTDLFSYEKWRGLKNKQLFIVKSESSESIMKDNLDAKKDESLIHNTATILSEILNYETQINNLADDSTKNNEDQNLKFINDNLMVSEKADYEVVGDEVLNNERNDFDIPLNYLEKNPKINSHIPYTPKRDSSNFFCTSQVYTSTPLLDHSYAKLISSSAAILLEDIGSLDEERDSPTNGEVQRNPKTEENFDIQSKNPTLNAEAVTNTFIAEKRRLKPENQEKGNNDQNLIAPHPKNDILCNEEIVKKNVGKVKNSGKHEIEGKMISKGFYFRPYPEIKLLNERKTSRKKGFLLLNGNLCSLIQIKNAQYPWNFNNEKFKNMPIQRNGIKVYVKNTCGLDTIVHIVQFSALDNPTYHSYIENSANATLQLIFNFMKTGLTRQILLDRLKILNQFHTIEKDPDSTNLSPYFLDAETFITRSWSNFLDSEPSGYETYQCTNKDCIGKEIQKIPFLSINENVIRQNGYQVLQDALLYHPQIFNIKCLQPGCTGTLTKKTDLNIHICIELDVRDCAARERSIACSLHDFPISLNLERKYRLAGVIHYISRHFIAYCLRASGSWICCDDLKGRIDGVKPKTIVNPHAVIYVLE